ncbi:[citrate (pro-3S)-lyase] ligase [Leuconostocaceae bacterium ESL0958]|nr:[citrate (pro-3S)-lyase] ligase [Leuconostocaceae bacterium ESL0958]
MRDLFLTTPAVRRQWQTFLDDHGIHDFSEQETAGLDATLGLYDGQGQLVGTGSVAGQTIKYLAVNEDPDAPAGARFNQLVSALESHLAAAGIFHLFVVTKIQYQQSFEHVGFQTLAKTDQGLILEKGRPDINDYRQSLPKAPATTKRRAAIVMNANPFTKGHRYLIERALSQADFLYVFVVSEDVSLFTSEERLALVKAGTADLDGLAVVPGGPYMVSYLSFPAYFIADQEQAVTFQTALDISLFKDQIAQPLGINLRVVGSEPHSRTTAIYNQQMKKYLPPTVQVLEIPRLTLADGQSVVSATTVRQKIASGDLAALVDYLPSCTQAFIHQHLQTLQARLKKGSKTDAN